MQFGSVEEHVQVDNYGHSVSLMHMNDGIIYRILYFPDRQDDAISRRAIFNDGKYLPVEVHSELRHIESFIEKVRVTTVRCGPFSIEWQNGKVTEAVVPQRFPRPKISELYELEEDVGNYLTVVAHYTAILNLWKDKKNGNRSKTAKAA